MRLRFRQLLAVSAAVLGLCLCSGAQAAERWKDTFWRLEGVAWYFSDMDGLFYFILILTGVVLIAPEGSLIVFMIKYRKKSGEKSYYTHATQKLEMIGTIRPAVILIVI